MVADGAQCIRGLPKIDAGSENHLSLLLQAAKRVGKSVADLRAQPGPGPINLSAKVGAIRKKKMLHHF